MNLRILALTAVFTIAGFIPVRAHHPLSNYDLDHVRTLDGTLLELRLANPHSFLTLTVREEAGPPEQWTIEWGPALLLKRQGVAPGTLASGDHLIVTGFAALDPTDRRIRLRTVHRPADGWTWTGGFE
jgi:hypothetical protein